MFKKKSIQPKEVMKEEITKADFDNLLYRVKSLESRNAKSDRDTKLVETGFNLKGEPEEGSMALCKYLEGDNLAEQFFESYKTRQEWFNGMSLGGNYYPVPPYAWKKIECKKKTKTPKE